LEFKSVEQFTFGYQLGRSNDLRQFSGTNRLADALIGRIRNTDAFNATHNLSPARKRSINSVFNIRVCARPRRRTPEPTRPLFCQRFHAAERNFFRQRKFSARQLPVRATAKKTAAISGHADLRRRQITA
jgi:hypothetical protein